MAFRKPELIAIPWKVLMGESFHFCIAMAAELC